MLSFTSTLTKHRYLTVEKTTQRIKNDEQLRGGSDEKKDTHSHAVRTGWHYSLNTHSHYRFRQSYMNNPVIQKKFCPQTLAKNYLNQSST